MFTTGPMETTEIVDCWLRFVLYDQPMRLHAVTPAALYLKIHVIRYTDLITLNVFCGGGFSFYLAKLCHFTAKTIFEYVRGGAHCVSQHGILRGDFWKLLASGISEN